MVIDHTDPFAPPAKPDPSLIKAIVNAHRFKNSCCRQVCRSGQDRETASILLQLDSPPRLPRPRHHHRHPRATTAPQPHRHDADRAPTPAAELAGAANRTRLRFRRIPDPITETAPAWPFALARLDLRVLAISGDAHPQSSASATTPEREIPRHRSLFRRPAVALPAQPTRRCRNGPENAVFSTTRRRLYRTIESTRIGWLGD